MADSLAGRNVVITGAAGGIGRALAARCLRDGARVALLDVDAAALERTRVELDARADAGAGAATRALPCDVTDAAACARAVAAVVRTWGGVDLLVNNAGLSHHSPFAATRLDVLRRLMEVNFFGAVHCTRAALPSLVERRGILVVLTSVAGFSPLVGRSGYAASKHALHGLFDSLRAELRGTGVSVLLVSPSYTATGIDRHALRGDGTTGVAAKAVVGRMLPPAEVADAIVRAALRRRRRLCVAPVAKTAWWLSRLTPRLYEWMMVRAHAATAPPPGGAS